MNKRLINTANSIVKLEKGAQTFPEQKDKYIAMMDALTKNLSFAELIQIDNYIRENKLLTK